MPTKETVKPAPKKKFTKDDVKMLYKAIEYGQTERAVSLELLSAVAEPKKPSGSRSIDAFYAAPKRKAGRRS